jgi:hypothetical protein
VDHFNLFVAWIGGPAVGVGDGGIETVALMAMVFFMTALK